MRLSNVNNHCDRDARPPPRNINVNAFCPDFAETKIITELRDVLVSSGTPIIPVEKAGAL